MGLLDAIRPKSSLSVQSTEQRTGVIPWYGGGPSLNNPNVTLGQYLDSNVFGGGPSGSSSPNVTHGKALGIASVLAMVKIIAEDISISYINIETKDDKHRYVTDPTHYVNQLLQDPGRYSWFDVCQALIGNAALSGNGVAPLIRSSVTGRVVDIDIADYTEVTVYETVDGEQLWYQFSGTGLPTRIESEENVLHVKNFSLNGKVGISPVSQAKGTYTVPIEAQAYINQTLQEGGYGGGVVTTDKDMPAPARKMVSNYVRGTQTTNKIPVLDEGMTFTPNKMSPSDIGYSAIMKLSREQFAAIYRIPLPLVQDRDFSGKGTTSEVIDLHVKFCLNAWGRRLTEELERKLLTSRERLDTRIMMNFDSLLKGDPKTRGQFTKDMMASQVMTINEARELNGLPPHEDGDRFVDFQKSAEIDKDNINTKTVKPNETSTGTEED